MGCRCHGRPSTGVFNFWTVGPKVTPLPSIFLPCIQRTVGHSERICFSTLSQAADASVATTRPSSFIVLPSTVRPLYHHRKQNELVGINQLLDAFDITTRACVPHFSHTNTCPSADGQAGFAWKHLGHSQRTEFTLTVLTSASNQPNAGERWLALSVVLIKSVVRNRPSVVSGFVLRKSEPAFFTHGFFSSENSVAMMTTLQPACIVAEEVAVG